MKSPLHFAISLVGLAAWAGLAADSSPAAPPRADEEAIHAELRAVHDGLLDAINKADLDRQMTYLDPDIVVTWHNGEASRGVAAVRDYYNRMMNGPDRRVKGYHAEAAVDEKSILHGADTAIAWGTSVERFTLTSGLDFELHGRWNATLVRKDGRWRLASLSMNQNLFDNPLLNGARKMGRWLALAGLLGGLAAGILVTRFLSRR